MDEAYVRRDVYDERCAKYEGYFKSDKERLDAFTTLANGQERTLERVTSLLEQSERRLQLIEERQDKIDKRITHLEHKPGKTWERVSGYVLSALASGIVVFLLSFVFK